MVLMVGGSSPFPHMAGVQGGFGQAFSTRGCSEPHWTFATSETNRDSDAVSEGV